MSVVLQTDFKFQYVTANGVAAGYKLFTYKAGTSNKQATWTDSTQLTQSANPLILDSNGVAVFWADPTLFYKYLLTTPTDSDPPTGSIYTVDNISGALALYPATPAENNAGITGQNLQIAGFPEWAYIGRYSGGLINAIAVASAQQGIGTNYTLYIDQSYTLSANATVPNYMSLFFVGGGTISVAAGKTLTVNGPVFGPFSQAVHFSGAGTTVLSGAPVILNKYLSFTGAAFTPTNNIGTSGTAFTVDASISNVALVTMNTNVAAGSCTLANFNDGQTVNLWVLQDTTGGRTLGNPTGLKWANGTAITLSTGANAIDVITIQQVVATKYATFAKQFS